MGIDIEGDYLGAPAYHPTVLLCAWFYGFMTGVGSSQKLEAACRNQIVFLWLTGWQQPDHNTFWRFYKAHRPTMRSLLKHTVRTAVEVGLVHPDVVGAIDSTNVAANAAGDQTYTAARLERLLAICAAITGLFALVVNLLFPAFGGISTQAATVFFSAVFLCSLAKANRHIRRKEIRLHRERMVRTFALAMGVASNGFSSCCSGRCRNSA